MAKLREISNRLVAKGHGGGTEEVSAPAAAVPRSPLVAELSASPPSVAAPQNHLSDTRTDTSTVDEVQDSGTSAEVDEPSVLIATDANGSHELSSENLPTNDVDIDVSPTSNDLPAADEDDNEEEDPKNKRMRVADDDTSEGIDKGASPDSIMPCVRGEGGENVAEESAVVRKMICFDVCIHHSLMLCGWCAGGGRTDERRCCTRLAACIYCGLQVVRC